MPRSSWSSWSSSPKSSKPAVSRPASLPATQPSRPATAAVSVPAPVPAPPSSASAVQHNVKVEQPGFFSNMWQGFGLGAGQAIAHNIFRSDPTVKHVHENELPKEFVQCMKDNHNDADLCKQFIK